MNNTSSKAADVLINNGSTRIAVSTFFVFKFEIFFSNVEPKAIL